MSTKFIVRDQINSAILRIIETATREIDQVSLYLDPSEHLAKAIERQSGKVAISIYFRADKQGDYKEALLRFKKIGVSCYPVPNLHAKIYRNEKLYFVGSMNLTKSSVINSEECGIYSDDPELTAGIAKFISELRDMAIKIGDKPIVRAPSPGVKIASTVVNLIKSTIDDLTQKGYCIRCGDKIEWNKLKPLCATCFREWRKFENPDYTEKFCHRCGKKKKTSITKPLCIECFKAS